MEIQMAATILNPKEAIVKSGVKTITANCKIKALMIRWNKPNVMIVKGNANTFNTGFTILFKTVNTTAIKKAT